MVKKKDEIPSWVTDEIQNAKFEKPKKLKKNKKLVYNKWHHLYQKNLNLGLE